MWSIHVTLVTQNLNICSFSGLLTSEKHIISYNYVYSRKKILNLKWWSLTNFRYISSIKFHEFIKLYKVFFVFCIRKTKYNASQKFNFDGKPLTSNKNNKNFTVLCLNKFSGGFNKCEGNSISDWFFCSSFI